MKQHRKRSKKWLIILALLLAGFLLFWFAGRRRIPQGVMQEMEDRLLVTGANEVCPSHCVTEQGMIYGKNHTICYMDLATKTEYVLCDEINCTHLTSNCSSHYGDDMNGLALYRGKVYYFDLNENGSAYEFIGMDMAGNQKKTIASIRVGNFDVGDWYLHEISNVYYCGDHVWAELAYSCLDEQGKEIRQSQCIAISLDTGEMTDITPREETEVFYQYEGFSEDYILIQRSWTDFSCEQQDREAFYSYHVHTGTLSFLEEKVMIPMYLEDGTYNGSNTNYSFLGWYDNGFLCEITEDDARAAGAERQYLIWDPETNRKTERFSIERAAAILFGEGNVGDNVYDDSELLVLKYKDNDKIDICKLDLKSGELSILFEDESNVTFRIIGHTKDSFIGKVYELGDIVTTVQVYAVKKEDYYRGDFSHMELLQTMRE